MLIIFGGTFNPIHVGHLSLAHSLYEKFNQPISFMPTGRNLSYKVISNSTPKQRLEMLELAIKPYSYYNILYEEIFDLSPCYTYKTLTSIRSKVGKSMPIFFVIGGDSLVSLDSWDEWKLLLELTNFVIASRRGYEFNLMSEVLKKEYNNRLDLENNYSAAGKFYLLDNFKIINLSSTIIRNLVKDNKPITGLVTLAVEEYITQQKLFF